MHCLFRYSSSPSPPRHCDCDPPRRRSRKQGGAAGILNKEIIDGGGFIKAEIVLNKIDELSLKFSPTIVLTDIKDEPDNRFLELAVFAKADFLITGNKNHFIFSRYGSLQIVSPKEYIETHFG